MLQYKIIPESAANKNVTFTLSNKLIASINNQGVVRGIKPGEGKITITTQDGSFNTEYELKVVCDHQWNTQIIEYAHCNKEGKKKRKCNICGVTEFKTIPLTGHSFLEWEITIQSSCLLQGTEVRKCAFCGIEEFRNTNALGHTWSAWKVTVEPSCMLKGRELRKCNSCGSEEHRKINAQGHTWSTWKIAKEATVLKAGEKRRSCSICGKTEKKMVVKLRAKVKLNMSKIPMKVKQSTSTLKVSGLAKGDKVKSYKSNNTKVATVNSKGKITAKKKGTAKITITLASGKKTTATVNVQTGIVRTSSIIIPNKNVTLKIGRTTVLKTVLTPLTSQQKVTYKTSNKKVATVSSKGKITAKKRGRTIITVKSGSKSVIVRVSVK